MKTRLLSIISVAALLVTGAAAQSILDLPRQSQHAEVMQRVGLTNISVSYSRPLVNGRKVWGGLVPYDAVWRAGANENTVITFSDPVSIEGQPLAKGSYGLHMLPTQNDWTVIFSRQAGAWGSFSYNKDEDALRVTVKPQPSEMQEALAYTVDAVPNSAVVTLRWEKLAVPFKVAVDVDQLVPASLKEQLRGGAQYVWESWAEASQYLYDHKLDLNTALKYADTSIGVEERFDNMLLKSQVLDALNRQAEAKPALARAMEMGNAAQLHTYGRLLQIRGKQDEAFEVFRVVMKRFPNSWAAHNEAARFAVTKGDYDTAVKEMKASVPLAPQGFRVQLEALVKRLEQKQDINK
ncbi:MAG TPA: DUF2911 domain-containing protein [Terriglobales bacterium]|nr:DUF2911 domain-containing protein [Terriglobales bacterium]